MPITKTKQNTNANQQSKPKTNTHKQSGNDNTQSNSDMDVNASDPFTLVKGKRILSFSSQTSSVNATCSADHKSPECPKPRLDPPKCALCSGDHPASYKGCTIYKDLQKVSKNHFLKVTLYQHTLDPTHQMLKYSSLQ